MIFSSIFDDVSKWNIHFLLISFCLLETEKKYLFRCIKMNHYPDSPKHGLHFRTTLWKQGIIEHWGLSVLFYHISLFSFRLILSRVRISSQFWFFDDVINLLDSSLVCVTKRFWAFVFVELFGSSAEIDSTNSAFHPNHRCRRTKFWVLDDSVSINMDSWNQDPKWQTRIWTN